MRTLKTIVLAVTAMLSASGHSMPSASSPRYTLSLDGPRWHMMRDTAASWEHDRLYLPEEITSIEYLPVNAPTGGWEMLTPENAVSVSVPGTVEEYLTTSKRPSPDDFKGVSWWFTTVSVPGNLKGRRAMLHFESVRMRAEVYLDGRLVGYDIIGESPFDVDITDALVPGKTHTLAVRVTNPGGNFHWQDFTQMRWGDYKIPPGRGFGGLVGRVRLDVVDAVYIEDIYMQNQPVPTRVKAIVNVRNTSPKTVVRTVGYTVTPKSVSDKVVARGSRKLYLEPGDNSVELEIDVPDARLWDIDSPELYQCDVTLSDGTTLLLLKSPESWMPFLNPAAGIGYESNFTVGADWVGGVHFVTYHPVLSGLPVNTAMNWPYQELVKEGNSRLGFKIAVEAFHHCVVFRCVMACRVAGMVRFVEAYGNQFGPVALDIVLSYGTQYIGLLGSRKSLLLVAQSQYVYKVFDSIPFIKYGDVGIGMCIPHNTENSRKYAMPVDCRRWYFGSL